jgi:hypothetical protein
MPVFFHFVKVTSFDWENKIYFEKHVFSSCFQKIFQEILKIHATTKGVHVCKVISLVVVN